MQLSPPHTCGNCLAISPPTNTASRYTHRFWTVSHCSMISEDVDSLNTQFWISFLKGALYLCKTNPNTHQEMHPVKVKYECMTTKGFESFYNRIMKHLLLRSDPSNMRLSSMVVTISAVSAPRSMSSPRPLKVMKLNIWLDQTSITWASLASMSFSLTAEMQMS